jgi:hypothetical protein
MPRQGNEIEKHRLSVLADELGQEVRAAEDAARDAVSHAIRAGELLIEAKSLVKHGEWLPWLDANFPGSERTAQTWMRLASKSAAVADLPTVREAVAMLTAPKPGPPSRGELVTLAGLVAVEAKKVTAKVKEGTLDPQAVTEFFDLLAELNRGGELYRKHQTESALKIVRLAAAKGKPEMAAAAARAVAALLASDAIALAEAYGDFQETMVEHRLEKARAEQATHNHIGGPR